MTRTVEMLGWTAAALIALLSVAACGGCDKEKLQPADAGWRAADSGPSDSGGPCARDADCESGSACVNGVCQCSTGDRCGPSCSPCPTVEHATVTCDRAACAIACDAGYLRSGDACIPTPPPGACATKGDGEACDGRDKCNGVCQGGECGAPVQCPALDACHTNACDPSDGTCHAALVSCPADGDPCTEAACDARLGCNPPVPQDTRCDANGVERSCRSTQPGGALQCLACNDVDHCAGCLPCPSIAHAASVACSSGQCEPVCELGWIQQNGACVRPSWQLAQTGGPAPDTFAGAVAYDPGPGLVGPGQVVVVGGSGPNGVNGLRHDLWRLPLSFPGGGAAPSGTWSMSSAPGMPDGDAAALDGALANGVLTVVVGVVPGAVVSQTWRITNALGVSPSAANVTPTLGPRPRYEAAAAFDAPNDRVFLLFGRDGDPVPPSDGLWRLEHATVGTPNWTQISLTNPPFSARFNHTLVYVPPPADRLVVFGGREGSQLASDAIVAIRPATGSSAAWTTLNVLPASGCSTGETAPGPRYGHSAAYSRSSQRMIVFGGVDASGALRNDVWVLDGAAGNSPRWICLEPSGPPAPRFYAYAAYDERRNALIVVGGSTTPAQDRPVANDVWVLFHADGS